MRADILQLSTIRVIFAERPLGKACLVPCGHPSLGGLNHQEMHSSLWLKG
jgi:hypothetical protein